MAHKNQAGVRAAQEPPGQAGPRGPAAGQLYEAELFRLQAELVKAQEWVRAERPRIVVIFEGRDAAGKGSTIKRVTQYLNPRSPGSRPSPRRPSASRRQWYFQRYIEHLPAAGQIVLFDRSWYNRAGVERVMGFCTEEEYARFLHQCPIFERLLVGTASCCAVLVFGQRRGTAGAVPVPLEIPCAAGSCHRWTWSRSPGGRTTHGPRTRCSVRTDIPEAPW